MTLSGAGCATTPPPIAPSSSNPARLSTSIAAGRSPDLATSTFRAYWIWHDEDGVWHVRTTARRVGRQFRGVVRPMTGGEITDMQGVGITGDDRLGMVGRTISFDWRTRSSIDGFDFRLKGDACLEFDLRIDGDGTATYIYLGKTAAKPERAHFLLCP
jgi:hypothetical protein